MASWLKQLEFRNVQVPPPTNQARSWGHTCGDVEVWFRGSRVMNVKMELQAYGKDYIIGTAASDTSCVLGPFQTLDLEQDVYPSARISRS